MPRTSRLSLASDKGYLPRRGSFFWRLIATGGLFIVLSSCSVRKLAVNTLGDALAGGASVYASDDDPELVRDALPFALKTIESLLNESPEHEGLLTAAASGFTQYSYAFVDTDAFLSEDRRERARLEDRALRLYLRGRDYGVRGLELRVPNLLQGLRVDPAHAVAEVGGESVELAYWTAAAWGAAISLAQDRAELVADLDAVRALLRRVLALDPEFGAGAVHEAFISLESLPPMMGGSPERAREHFERAVELSNGNSVSPYVALASTVAVTEQDLDEFRALLDSALAIDPDGVEELRLANRIAQKRARALQGRAEELFLDFEMENP